MAISATVKEISKLNNQCLYGCIYAKDYLCNNTYGTNHPQLKQSTRVTRVCKCKNMRGIRLRVYTCVKRVKLNAIHIYTHSSYLSQNDPPYDQWCL